MKNIIGIVIAAVLAIVAMVAVRQVIKDAEKKAKTDTKTADIVVASKKLEKGTRLRGEDLESRAWPANLTIRGMLGSDGESTLFGKEINQEVNRGDPILDSYVEIVMKTPASEVPEGYRALTIAVDQISGIAGLIRVGSRVDILATFEEMTAARTGQGGEDNRKTITLLSNVPVLAIDDRTNLTMSYSGQKRGYTAVTVVVTPHEAKILTLAQLKSVLTLTLRNPADSDILTLDAPKYDWTTKVSLSEIENTAIEANKARLNRITAERLK